MLAGTLLIGKHYRLRRRCLLGFCQLVALLVLLVLGVGAGTAGSTLALVLGSVSGSALVLTVELLCS